MCREASRCDVSSQNSMRVILGMEPLSPLRNATLQGPVAASELHLAKYSYKEIKRTRLKGPHECRRAGRRIQADSHTCWGRDMFPCSQECTKLYNDEADLGSSTNKCCMSDRSSLHRRCRFLEHSSMTRASIQRGKWLCLSQQNT
jgi:hypothetical protein